MGKYHNFCITSEDSDGKQITQLNNIANELAELNRLKRHELELKIIEMEGLDPEIQSSIDKEKARQFLNKVSEDNA